MAGLVHDLNNVFETISEAAELIGGDPKWRRIALTIQRNVVRGRRLVSGMHQTSTAAFDFELILDSAIEFSRDYLQAARRPPIQFHRDVEPALRLRGNPVAWERVLVNLFLNAAQASKTGVSVFVNGRRSNEGTEIVVADDGPGIPDKILPQIFKPRFSTKSAQSGLGLHIVESIVKENGGTVRAASRIPGPGAEFRILVPASG
jgi:signal transduction histidine kinase